MKKAVFIWLGILLFSAGCTGTETEQNEEPKEVQQGVGFEEIKALEERIGGLEKQITETQEEQKILEQMIMSHDGLGYGEIRRSQQMLEDLIRHLPEIKIKTGFITGMEKESINIDFAEKVGNAEAPNGFEIINESEVAEEFPVIEELTVFVLNGTDLEIRTKEEFNPSNHFFFEFYIVDGKVIQMREVYLP